MSSQLNSCHHRRGCFVLGRHRSSCGPIIPLQSWQRARSILFFLTNNLPAPASAQATGKPRSRGEGRKAGKEWFSEPAPLIPVAYGKSTQVGATQVCTKMDLHTLRMHSSAAGMTGIFFFDHVTLLGQHESAFQRLIMLYSSEQPQQIGDWHLLCAVLDRSREGRL